MNKKFRFYLPVISGDKIAKIVAVLCIVDAIVHYWHGDINRASFWLIWECSTIFAISYDHHIQQLSLPH